MSKLCSQPWAFSEKRGAAHIQPGQPLICDECARVIQDRRKARTNRAGIVCLCSRCCVSKPNRWYQFQDRRERPLAGPLERVDSDQSAKEIRDRADKVLDGDGGHKTFRELQKEYFERKR